MATSFKANSIAAELADKLTARGFGALTITQGFDSDSNPYMFIGAQVAGGRNALIKVRPIDWPLAQDVLGNSANMYTPHVIQLCTEANYAATSDNVADTLTTADILGIVGQCVMMGTVVEWYQSLTGDAPDLADITAANLKATFHPDVYRPYVSAQ